MLFNAGDHVPEIPLLEVVGKAVNVALAHEDATCVNVGVTVGLTLILTAVLVLSQVPIVCDA